MLRCIPNGDSLLVAGGKDSSIRETTSIDSSPLVVIVLVVVVVVGIDRPPPLVLPTVSLLRTLSTVSTASFAFFPSPFSLFRETNSTQTSLSRSSDAYLSPSRFLTARRVNPDLKECVIADQAVRAWCNGSKEDNA